MSDIKCTVCGTEFVTLSNGKGCSPECKEELIKRSYKRKLAKRCKNIYLKKEL